jgi:hypothetical protein
MQITPYSIFSNYKLSMAALITFFRCNPIVWKPHQCAHDVLNNSLCLWVWVIHVMDRFPKWHFGWIVHKIFYIPIITPYDICQLAHQICFRPQSCGMLLDHLSRGICNFWLTVNKKQLWGNPPTFFFCIRGIFLLCKAIQWWHHHLQAPSFTPIAHTYVHNI